MPTHLERYGFFLYDPQADIVTIGNPALRTEKSMNLDARVVFSKDGLRLSGGLFMQSIEDYIAAPLSTTDGDTSLDLRMMQNIGSAFLTGADVAITMQLSQLVAVGASLGYTYAKLSATKEPLPLIQPLTMRVDARVGDEDMWGELRVRGSLAQQRISTSLMPEDATTSWATVDLSAGLRIASSITARILVGNILDTYYNEHTSIRNLAARGRSLSISLRYSW
jgi:outer membrane receptor protein involved in Fe transport